jgi:hypothetical protein
LQRPQIAPSKREGGAQVSRAWQESPAPDRWTPRLELPVGLGRNVVAEPREAVAEHVRLGYRLCLSGWLLEGCDLIRHAGVLTDEFLLAHGVSDEDRLAEPPTHLVNT